MCVCMYVYKHTHLCKNVSGGNLKTILVVNVQCEVRYYI